MKVEPIVTLIDSIAHHTSHITHTRLTDIHTIPRRTFLLIAWRKHKYKEDQEKKGIKKI